MTERLRNAFAAGAGRAAGEGCPTDEEIWAASRGELPAARRDALLAHSAGCAACAESWRMAAAIAAEASLPAGKRHPAKHGLRLGLGLLAAAAVVVVALLTVPTRPPADALRAPGGVAIESELPAGKPLARDRCVLHWSGGPPGTLYAVEVAREDLTVLLRAESVEEPEYRIPENVLASLPPGATLFWRVEAVLPDAKRIESPVFRSTLE